MLDRKGKPEEKLRPQAAAHEEPKAEAGAAPVVIALHDLRTGPEADIHRLETRIVSLNDEIGYLRRENQRLTTANLKLDADLREIRLLLSKVQVSELRGLERVTSWLRR